MSKASARLRGPDGAPPAGREASAFCDTCVGTWATGTAVLGWGATSALFVDAGSSLGDGGSASKMNTDQIVIISKLCFTSPDPISVDSWGWMLTSISVCDSPEKFCVSVFSLLKFLDTCGKKALLYVSMNLN